MKILVLTLLAAIYLASAADVQEGYCLVHGTDVDPDIRGSIIFKKNGESVDMIVDIWGITMNVNITHGIHVHQFGDLSSPVDGSSVGSHFNPAGEQHGCPPSLTRHLGDTGNWEVSVNGSISATKTLNLLTLTGVNSIIGRAVILHSTTDDCSSTTSAGSRLAWCVIGVKNPGANYNNTASNDYEGTTVAVCDLQPTQLSNVTGRVWLQKSGNDTIVTASITGITGPHGFHIHQFGDLSSNVGTAVGGHYNPNSVLHGIPDHTPRHVGDMGNIYHYVGDVAYYKYTHSLIQLTGENNVIGHAIIVHQQKDDCAQPTGNAGSRYAQCVIGIAQDSTTPVGKVPGDIPTTQDDAPCTATSATSEADTSATAEDSGTVSLAASVVLALAAMFVVF